MTKMKQITYASSFEIAICIVKNTAALIWSSHSTNLVSTIMILNESETLEM